jgi:F-type H+-transporting ATPase subunit a
MEFQSPLILAEFNLIEHISDHAWPGCTVVWEGHRIVLMSSAIASMILVAIAMLVFVLPLARRAAQVPRGRRNVLEVLVLFVREWIAKPALHHHADKFMPYLLTQFLFFLGMNLIGLLPLVALSEALTGGKYPVGATPTAVLTVTGANAAMVLVLILGFSMRRQAQMFREHHKSVPIFAALLLSPFLFAKSLVPPVPGVAGYVLWFPLLIIEMISLVARSSALMIRLFANMIAGHSMLAVFLMFIVTAGSWVTLTYIGTLSVLASVFVSLLELLVATLQAYIFTFLSAIFLGLYMEPSH